MTEDDKAKESYLEARGWMRVQRPIPHAEHWMLAWYGEVDPDRLIGKSILFPLDSAVRRQLRWDAHGLVYFLESLDEKRPETRKLVGGQLLLLVGSVLKEFIKDKGALLRVARTIGEVMRDAEDDPEHKANMAAISRAYEMGKRKDPKEKAN